MPNKILSVDDDALNRDIIAEYLTDAAGFCGALSG